MEQFRERKKNKESKNIILSFEFDTGKQEVRDECKGIDITFWTRASKEKGKVDICINVFPRRGNLKELDEMEIVLKEYDKIVAEGVVKKGFVTFENRERGVYVIEFILKEIKGERDSDVFIV